MKRFIFKLVVLCVHVCYSLPHGLDDDASQPSRVADKSKNQNQMLMIIGGRRNNYSGYLTHTVGFTNGSWHVQGALPRGMLKLPSATVGPMNKVVAVGGFGGHYLSEYHDCFILDPATKEWKIGPSLKISRHAHCVANLGTKIFAIGGISDYQYSLNTAEVWDMSQGESSGWKLLSNMTTDRVNAAAVAWKGDIYVTGGIKNYGASAKYIVEEDKWESIPKMLFNRSYHGLVALDNKIYAIGGSIYTTSTTLTSCESFDGEKWAVEPSMNEAREGHAVGVIDGKIYAIGGKKGYTLLNSIESFDPSTGVWRYENITGESPVPNTFGSAVVVDIN